MAAASKLSLSKRIDS